MGIIKAVKLAFDYLKYGEDENDVEKVRAIDDVTIDIEKGDFIAILGHNGSGKSTLAKRIRKIHTRQAHERSAPSDRGDYVGRRDRHR